MLAAAGLLQHQSRWQVAWDEQNGPTCCMYREVCKELTRPRLVAALHSPPGDWVGIGPMSGRVDTFLGAEVSWTGRCLRDCQRRFWELH